MNNSLVFNKLQPICDKIIRNRDPTDVETLYNMVNDTESFYLQNIQQFLLIPLLTRMGEEDSLKSRSQSDVKVKILAVVKLVLEKTEVRQVHALKTILIVLAKEVYDFQTAKLVSNVSEELTMTVLECIEVVNRRASSDSVEEFYRSENSSQICQIMYVILLLLDKSDSRAIKLKAIEALMSLLHVDDSSDESDLVLGNQIAGIIFFAVPMIWSSLSSLILNDPKIGHRVMERSLFALGRIICLIMEDDKIHEESSRELKVSDFKALLSITSSHRDNFTSILDQKEKKRTPEWLRAAGEKLKEPFQKLVTLTGHESMEIRKAVGVCCEQWVRRCRNSLADNLDTFLEILLILSEDENQTIREYFSDLFDAFQSEGNGSLVTVNRELIQRHLTRMSRIIHRRSEKEQIAALSLLKGQLKRLPEEDLLLLFSNPKSLEVFVLNLLLFIEFNSENGELLKEEFSIREYVDPSESSRVIKRPWEEFKYFDKHNSKVIPNLKGLFSSLGGRSGTRILIENLLELLKDRPRNVAEILKILQFIISSSSEGEEDLQLIEKLLDELLDEKYWNLSFGMIRNYSRGGGGGGKEHLKVSEFTEGLYESSLVIKYVDLNQQSEGIVEYLISPQEAKLNVLVTCVLMETVAIIGQKLGAERFQKTVFKTLFNLLSNAGNSNKCIHAAGLLALTEITQLYELNGIRELIMRNSDYVMFFVNQNLRHEGQSEAALDVISVMLQFCSKDVLGYVELIVQRLLSECTKFHKMGNLPAYLKIFGLFLKNLSPDDEEKREEIKSPKEIVKSWMEILNPKVEDEEDILVDNIEEDQDPEEIPEPPTVQKETPKEIEIARQIMEVALKHVSSKNQSDVLAAMETLTYGVSILRQSEDDLLPLVHQIWYPLSKRFTEENPVVLRNVLQMLVTLADSAKEFIHRRTVDEVVPKLNKILNENLSVLLKAKDEGGDRFTQQFRLVHEIITNYHTIIIRLNVQQKHLDDILTAVALYLNRSLPKVLTNSAKDFFIALRSYDAPAVYQKLRSCKCDQEIFL